MTDQTIVWFVLVSDGTWHGPFLEVDEAKMLCDELTRRRPSQVVPGHRFAFEEVVL